MTIYTLGYSGWKFEEVDEVLARLDAVLVDVRMVPRSRWAPGWNARVLHARMGEKYVWLKELGNRNYKGTFEQIDITDFPAGEQRLRELVGSGGKNIVLFCGCRDVNVCHRKVLAEWLGQKWNAEVVHLTPPGGGLTHRDNGISSGQARLF